MGKRKLGILNYGLAVPRFSGGGPVHTTEVVKRLAESFEIYYFPASNLFPLTDKEIVKEKVRQLESQGIKVSESFKSILDSTSPITFRRLLDEYKKEIENLEFIYDPDILTTDIIDLGIKNYGFTVHGPMLLHPSLFRSILNTLRIYDYSLISVRKVGRRILAYLNWRKFTKALKRNPPKFIAGVSKAAIEVSKLDWVPTKKYVLNPSNAINKDIIKFRGEKKEDYIVYWGRILPEKGILELLEVVKLLGNSKLKVMGSFARDVEPLFKNKVKKLGIEDKVELLGFVNEKTKYEVASKAKALVYPTHFDAFSITVLESLAVGTPVVTYDIPAIKEIYGDLKAVRIVREFNVKGLTIEVKRLLQMNDDEIQKVMNEQKLLEFLETHSSWDNVAEGIKRIILENIE